jgi:Family of unknown function (DUF6463)
VLEADLVRLSLGPLFLIGLLVIVRLGEKKAGRLLMLTGVLHVLGGAWVARGPLARMAREGLLGTADSALGRVPSRTDMEAVFWFMLWGVVTFTLGHLVAWVEGQGRRLPAAIGWELVLMNLAALVFYPKGGFWLVLIPSFMIIRESRRPPGTPVSPATLP